MWNRCMKYSWHLTFLLSHHLVGFGFVLVYYFRRKHPAYLAYYDEFGANTGEVYVYRI